MYVIDTKPSDFILKENLISLEHLDDILKN